MQALDRKFVKTYEASTIEFKYTTTVRHKGTVIAFAMDDQRRIYYTVLDLDRTTDPTRSQSGTTPSNTQLDVNCWNIEPQELRFPTEIEQVGYRVATLQSIPRYRKSGPRVESGDILDAAEIDQFRSTTARLTANAPIQVLSDDKYVYVFRQAIAANDRGNLFSSPDPSNLLSNRAALIDDTLRQPIVAKQPKYPFTAIVDNTLLLDRFVYADGKLSQKREVRYQRSRSKDLPASRKDALGYEDLEKKPFYEPTQELSFIKNLVSGQFSIVLVPTALPDVQRWQIFAYSSVSKRMDCFSVERSSDGLFNTRGTRYYTDPQRPKDVFERSPVDPATGKATLVPIISQSDYAESALAFDGSNRTVIIPDPKISDPKPLNFGSQDFTIELWLQVAPSNGAFSEWTLFEQKGEGGLTCSIRYLASGASAGKIRVDRTNGEPGLISMDKINDGQFHHLAVIRTTDAAQPAKLLVFIDGEESGSSIDIVNPQTAPSTGSIFVGSRDGTQDFFMGTIDELRVWNRGRSVTEIQDDRHHRLIGNEPGLAGYWRFDEGSDETAYDQTDFTNHAQLLNPKWITSKAPVGDHPGVRRSSFTIVDRAFTAGCSALLYYQQEQAETGYTNTEKKPIKRGARVMLAMTTAAKNTAAKDKDADPHYIAVMDFAVSREGTLAQVPDMVKLQPLEGTASQNASLDKLKKLEEDIRSRKTRKEEIEAELVKLTKDHDEKFKPTRRDGLRFTYQVAANKMLIAYDIGVGQVPFPDGPINAYKIENLPDWATVKLEGKLPSNRSFSKTYDGPTTTRWVNLDKLTPHIPPIANPILTLNIKDSYAAELNEMTQKINARKDELLQLEALLSRDQQELKRAREAASKTVSLPMAFLQVDSTGLITLGSLLKFAWTPDAPILFESVDGRVSLYFRGEADQFFAAYYDVMAGRASFYLPTFNSTAQPDGTLTEQQDGTLTFTARTSGAAMEKTEITIAPATDTETCQVTIANSLLNDVKEVWNQVPRDPQAFAAVLNGTTQLVYVGKLIEDYAGKVSQIDLDGRRGQLTAGSVLLVGNAQTKATIVKAEPMFDGSIEFKGQALEFDGENDYVQIPDAQALGLTNNSFTIEAWVSITDFTGKNGDRPILGTDDKSQRQPNKALQTIVRNARPRLGFFENDTVIDDTVPVLKRNVWYHLSWRYDQANQEQAIFINGELVRAERNHAPFSGTGRLAIGRWDEDRYFKGLIGEVRIWNEARSKDDIRADMSRLPSDRSPKLTACWRFEYVAIENSPEPNTAPPRLIAKDYATDDPARNGVVMGNPQLTAIADHRRVQIQSIDLTAKANESVYLLPYDYAALAQTRSGQIVGSLSNGSRLVSVSSQDAGESVTHSKKSQIAKSNGAGFNCRWFADSQGNALNFDSDTSPEVAPALNAADFAAESDCTIETWINPTTMSQPVSVVRQTSGIETSKTQPPETSQYHLTLSPESESLSAYRVLFGVGTQVQQTRNIFPYNTWNHIAATFNQSYALRFDGQKNHVDCGTERTLDITDDLTIELYFTPESLDGERGLLHKGKEGEGMPYALFLDDDQLKFAYEDESGTYTEVKSADYSFAKKTFYRIALTRHKRNATTLKEDGTEVILKDEKDFDSKIHQYSARYDITFYVQSGTNPTAEIGRKTLSKVARSSSLPCQIGSAITESGRSFQGTIAEVRIWNTTRTQDELFTQFPGTEKGLVSWWQFEENQGNLAYDSKSNNHGTRIGATWVKSPDPRGSQLRLYVNGERQITTNASAFDPIEPQFSIGTVKNGSNYDQVFQGQLDEIRIWKTVRTEEQIQDNLFRRLMGDFEQLIAYYTCDANLKLKDESGRGLDLSLLSNGGQKTEDAFTISTAPISNETAKVRSALAGVKTDFHDVTSSTPGVQEYGDRQYDSDGNMIGVMKRCYSYIQAGKWLLISGFKVGDLELEWIGQAQYEPQLVGFIEGAPPVPSENLTVRDANQGEIYDEVSAVELTEADRIAYTYSASKEQGLDFSMQGRAGVGVKSRTSAGVALITGIEETSLLVGTKFGIDISQGWLNEQQSGVARGTNRISRMNMTGSWEDTRAILPERRALGRRYVPKNVGFALVKSKTADIFAMRLKHRNPEKRVTVALTMRANPDIPEDWNIITFPLNPRYTKQGTLDGKIGLTVDKDYPNATEGGNDRSYFKPIEAYALKNRIEKEQQQLATDYQNYSVQQTVNGMTDLENLRKRLPNATQMNLFNTYVWTAEGGFFAETQNTMSMKQEVIGSNFSVAGMAGGFIESELMIAKAAVMFELEVMLGGHLNLTSQRSQESETGFEVNVSLDVERDITLKKPRDKDDNPIKDPTDADGNPLKFYDLDGNPIKCPGKVDGYRFMTFYLQPDKEHFQDFANKVIDRVWLEQSSDASAAALRQAIVKNSGTPWRVLHRVTYVSRVLPELLPENTFEGKLRAANFESNWELIQQLDPYVKAKTGSYAQLQQAVEQTIDLYLPELASKEAKKQVVNYMSLYYQVFPSA